VPIAVAFTLVAPLLFWAYFRRPLVTMLALIVCDLGFELVAPYMGLLEKAPFLYSACILRYGAALAVGSWIADDESLFSRRNWFVLPYALLGFAYIVVSKTTAFALPFLPMWGTQNLASFGWGLLLFLVMVKAVETRVLSSAIASTLARIGQASYSIFVLQIGYFSIGLWALIRSAGLELGLPLPAMGALLLVLLVMNLLVCLLLGVWWQERLLARW